VELLYLRPFIFGRLHTQYCGESQRRILGGALLLLCTLILPAVVGTVLFFTRTAKVLDDVSSAMQKSAATSRAALDTQRDETSRKIFAELRERKALYDDKLSKLESFRVLDAKLYKDQNSFSTGNTIELTVQNDTALPVSRAYFRAVYVSPGCSSAWVEDTFNYRIPGGLEPGEKSTWKLLPFGDLGRIEMKPDATFTITVTRLDGPDEKQLFSDVRFSESDQKRLIELEEQYKE
jgi:hypothetical protein